MTKPGLLAVQRASGVVSRIALLCAGSSLAVSTALAEGLSGGSVAAGAAQIGANVGGQTTITQTSSKAVINWQNFSVGSGEAVRFVQPDRNSVTLNRVIGNNVSKIDGSLTANGQVWLLNPNGVLIGGGGRVSAAGFLATTRNLGDSDFFAGRNNFAGSSDALIGNAGSISIDNGYAILAGSKIDNSGLVEANLGQVVLAAGSSYTLDLSGDKLISFAVTTPLEVLPDGGAITNSGTLRADGGRVLITARSAAAIVDSVINTTGIIQARSASVVDGEVVFDGGEAGTVNVNGSVDASGQGTGQTGGRIIVLGDTIVAGNSAKFDARGDTGGGEIYLGGGWQGESLLTGRSNAVRVAVLGGAVLDASAITSGNGGTVVAWSDVGNAASITRAFGTFNALGGANSGNGGRIETSGHFLDTAGVKGSASAALGTGGEWLFDPFNISIVNSVPSNGSFDAAGNWTPTGSPSLVSTADISARLSAGTSVTISTGLTGSAGPDAGNIAFDAGLTATLTTAVTLKLIATNAISLSGSISTAGTAPLNIVLEAGRSISLTGSAAFITTNNGNFTARLVNGAAPSGGEFITNAKSIQAGTGSIELRSTYTGGTTPIINVINDSSAILQTTTGSITIAAGDNGSLQNLGNLTTDSGRITFSTGSGVGASIQTNSGGGTLTTASGNIELLAGADATINSGATISTTGSFTVSGGAGSQANLTAGVTVGASVTVTAGQSIANTQTITTNNSNLNFTLVGQAQRVAPISVSNFGVLIAGTGSVTMSGLTGTINLREATVSAGNISLTSAAIKVGDIGGSGGVGSFTGTTIALATDQLIFATPIGGAQGFQGTSISLKPLLDATEICVANVACGAGLSVTTTALSFLQAPSRTIGSATGTGSLAINLPNSAAGSGTGQTTTFRMGGAGGVAVVQSLPGVSTTDTLRVVAGGNVTLSPGLAAVTAGKLDLVAGGQFINNAGTSAITSTGAGRWLIFSANPATNLFGGLVSGNLALWNRNPTDAVAGLITATSNTYAFSFQPTLTLTTLPRTKIYGDNFTLTSILGTDFTVAGLVSAAASGNAFSQDVVGPVTIASTGTPSAANAGTYAITATPGFAPVGYAEAVVSGVLTVAPRALIVSLSGTTTKVYNATTAATLTSGNYQLSNFVSGQTGTINQTAGSFLSANVGSAVAVMTSLGNGNLVAGSGTLASNYALPTSVTGNIGAITPKALTASLTGTAAKVYDGTSAAMVGGGNLLLTGFVSGQGATAGTLTGNFGSAGNPITNVGTGYSVTVNLGMGNVTANSGTLLSNYQLPSAASGNIGAITLRPLSVAIIGTVSKTYDGSTAASFNGTNFAIGNLVSGQSISIMQATGTYATKDVGSGISVMAALSGTYIAGQSTLLSNYALPASATGLIGRITERRLTIALTGTVVKVYDGNNTAIVTPGNVQVSGFAPGENVTLNSLTATYATPNAGVGIAVTADLANANVTASSGTNLNNYVTDPTVTGSVGTITPKPLAAVLVGTTTKIYDGNTAAVLNAANFQVSGFVGNDSATVTQTSGNYASANVGSLLSVSATVTLAANGASLLSNYQLPGSATGSIGTITQRDLAGSLVGATTKVYDGGRSIGLTGSNISLTGFVSGDGATGGNMSGTLSAADAGTGISVSLALNPQGVSPTGNTLLSNYRLPTTLTGLIGQVTPRPLSASLVGLVSKTYDGNTLATLNASNFAVSGFVQGQGATVTRTVGAYDTKDAASFLGVQSVLTASDFAANQGTNLSNYSTPALATGTVGEIRSRLLSVTLTGTVSKGYDGSTAVLVDPSNILLSNLVDGESIIVTRAPGDFATANVGTGIIVTIDPEFVDATPGPNTVLDNYEVEGLITGAIGTITARPVTVSLGGTISKTYDGTTVASLSAATLTLGNVLSNEVVTVSGTQTGSYDTANVGTRKRVTVAALTLGGAGASNYALTSPSVSALIGTVNRRTLTAVLTGTASKVYDGTTEASLAAANFQILNLVEGETLTVTPLTGSYVSKDVGTGITVNAALVGPNFGAGAGTLLTNYILPTSATGVIGVIRRRQLTAALNTTISKVYDNNATATLANGSITVSGFAGSETATVNQPTGTFASQNVGTGISISATLDPTAFAATSGTLLTNYVLPTALTGATGSITVRPVSATLIGAVTKTYDGLTAATLTSLNYALNNAAPGDTSVRLNNPASGTFATVGVGTGKTVNVTGLALVNGNGNYSLASTTIGGAIGSVTPATLAYVSTPVSRAQLVVNPTFTGTVTGFVNAETRVSATSGGDPAFASTADTASPQGSYPITGSGLTAANYIFVQAAANATALTITAPVTSATADAVAVRPSAITAAVTVTPVVTPTPVVAPPAPAAATPAATPAASEPAATPAAAADKPAESAAPAAAPAAAPPAGGAAAAPASAAATPAASGGDSAAAAPAPAPSKSAALPPPPPVDALPPSPVAAEKPPTPSDPADAGDPVLAAAGGGGDAGPPPAGGGGASMMAVAPGVSVELPSGSRSVGTADARFSETGDLSI